ncbi:anaerobic benzoate catabolism transcriptional regulator [Moraxella caprae]|uniref:Anaerobic benzoate catabolism transcriptional regulator n=1 Tax=Moraxella caprae TaxID=90240 RepID=A0A378QVR5_9GAMM|nr:helix-turn-helix transcriptional regulator [Moraxella caprae]STZ07133.1 anaerobic benzoate catabolism transcriptional regulator [Moraxella caprae]
MNTLKIFGKNIKNIRHSKQLSQEGLAEKAGLHRTYIGSVERGERNVSLINIVQIAKALEVSPSVLMENLELEYSYVSLCKPTNE